MRGEGAERRRNGDDWEEEVGLDEEMALGGGGCDEGREAEGELEQRRGEGEGSFARKDRLLNEDMCSRMMLGGLEKEEGEETGCEGKEGLGSDGPTFCERSSKVGCRAYGIYYVEIRGISSSSELIEGTLGARPSQNEVKRCGGLKVDLGLVPLEIDPEVRWRWMAKEGERASGAV
ncbi:hypothetical protein BDY24DRAFT_389004 [Mrakia frigida]|uniref:uncharacterized protein n=1 Tax=Mrakia frigida TaxID=29902 RepID=UPI003FCC0314